MENIEKTLSEITRKEWILYQWIEATQFGDTERYFLRGQERTPDEALNAAQEWDFLESVKNEDEQETTENKE
jgi:hypothetical protein